MIVELSVLPTTLSSSIQMCGATHISQTLITKTNIQFKILNVWASLDAVLAKLNEIQCHELSKHQPANFWTNSLCFFNMLWNTQLLIFGHVWGQWNHYSFSLVIFKDCQRLLAYIIKQYTILQKNINFSLYLFLSVKISKLY